MLHNQKATKSIRLTANFSSNICYNGNGHCQALSTRQIKQFALLFLAELKALHFSNSQILNFHAWCSTWEWEGMSQRESLRLLYKLEEHL